MSWRTANRLLYRLASGLRRRGGGRHVDRSGSGDGQGILYLSWGRLGDAILSSPFLERLCRLRPGPLVAVARPESAAVLQPRVDRFVPWNLVGREDLGAPFAAVVTDLHAFHGGLATVGPLLAGMPADLRIAYEGYVTRDRFVPRRPFPTGVSVVPSLPKTETGSDPEALHVWNDLEHYHAALARELGAEPAPGAIPAPRLHVDPDALASTLARFGLEPGGYWACQPATSIVKKDYPIGAWRRILGAFPERRFVLLGTARDASRTRGLRAAHVRDLAGSTDLGQALALIAGAAGFVGPDSGPTHAAVALGVPSVCIAQNANLGWFFPYPRRLNAAHLRVVHHPDYEECAGCFSLCAHEPIWSTYRRGALCLRTLPPDLVIEALREPPAPRPAPGGSPAAASLTER